jgi:hypothetical protein
MSILVLDDKTKASIERLKKKAEENPFSMDDLLDIHNKEKKAAGDDGFAIFIPVEYKVVYTIENQKHKIKHLSISVRPPKMPNPLAVEEIMSLFGFRNKLNGDVKVWIENGVAVNVVELY